MTHEYSALSLNITAFAQAGSQLSGQERLGGFERLREETEASPEGVQVQFAATGSVKTDAAGVDEPWLHLRGSTILTLTCQRCLGPVEVPVDFERNFRFVATEALAEVEDEESEEDVLVASRHFNVLELVEDELLMAIPAVPKHETCPQAVRLEAVDPDFEGDASEETLNPFAVLQKLKDQGLG